MLGYLLNIIYKKKAIPPNIKDYFKSSIFYFCAFLLVVSFSIHFSYKYLITDLITGKIASYHKQTRQRIEMIKTKKLNGKNKVTFHPINNLPASIGFDIKENSSP